MSPERWPFWVVGAAVGLAILAGTALALRPSKHHASAVRVVVARSWCSPDASLEHVSAHIVLANPSGSDAHVSPIVQRRYDDGSQTYGDVEDVDVPARSERVLSGVYDYDGDRHDLTSCLVTLGNGPDVVVLAKLAP